MISFWPKNGLNRKKKALCSNSTAASTIIYPNDTGEESEPAHRRRVAKVKRYVNEDLTVNNQNDDFRVVCPVSECGVKDKSHKNRRSKDGLGNMMRS